eukprot:TRINITY_DN5615_c0_g1_i1.p1 TRINITY_DN5615_c0_g1~~TRINITY_DN5615_c0_g1_i1.p1  ORF type:complete len:203 (+),score=52.84 TRINITY_DN5615_c0_g1_i1:57-665(+)
MDEAEWHRLFRVRRTVVEMIVDRGYVVQEEDQGDATKFRERFTEMPNREDLALLAVHKTDSEQKLFVFFINDEKVGVQPIRAVVDRMKADSAQHGIVVIRNKITPFAKQSLDRVEDLQIELFKESELLINITKHVLVPKHVVLTPEEKEELLTTYKLRDSQLPRIQITDAVSRYLGLQRGQVVRITRPSETAGRYVTYRLCI